MTSSTPAFKRSRPLLGTFFSIEVDDANSQSLVTQAFELAASLESKLSPHLPILPASPERDECLQIAGDLARISEGAFDPYVGGRLDLGGIAKGFIVDQVVELIQAGAPRILGVVNAGGDLRFFNEANRRVSLRLGGGRMQDFESPLDAVASSSPDVSMTSEISTTRYHRPLRSGLSRETTVTAMAPTCAVADALTKVGLFAPPQVIEKTVRHCQARLLVFDPTLIEEYGF